MSATVIIHPAIEAKIRCHRAAATRFSNMAEHYRQAGDDLGAARMRMHAEDASAAMREMVERCRSIHIPPVPETALRLRAPGYPRLSLASVAV